MEKTSLTANDIWFLKLALEEADRGAKKGEVPIGAVVVIDNKIAAASHNTKEHQFDPSGHAEVNALKAAANSMKNWRLTGATLYSTLEPCPMCLYTCIQARIERLVFGAYDPKGGAFSLGYNFNLDKRVNHKFKVTGGILHYDCSKLLSQFFRMRRGNNT